MTRRSLFETLLGAIAGTVLARMSFIGPKVEAVLVKSQPPMMHFMGYPVVWTNMDGVPQTTIHWTELAETVRLTYKPVFTRGAT